jgi:hypothetical protein
MTSSPKQAMFVPMIDRLRSAHRVVALAACFTAALAGAGCKKQFDDPDPLTDAAGTVDGSTIDGAAAIDAPAACNMGNEAPTYTELYDKYFGVGKTGHCAKSGCHGDPGHNVWLCGDSKDTCYQGMVTEGLINKTNPIASTLGDPKNSPLTWVNPDHGFMPQDGPRDFAEGRDAIIAWVGACAQNN